MAKNTKTRTMCVECGAILDEDNVVPIDQNGTVLCGNCGRAQLSEEFGEYSNGFEQYNGGEIVEEPFIDGYLSDDIEPLSEDDEPTLEQLKKEDNLYEQYEDADDTTFGSYSLRKKIRGSKVKTELPRVKLVEDRAFIQEHSQKIRKIRGGKHYFTRGTIPRDARNY